MIPPEYLFSHLFCFCLYGNNGRITSIYFLSIHFAVCTDLIIIGRRFFQFTVFVRCRTTFGYGLYFTIFSIFTVAAVNLITACTFYL